MSKLFRDTFVWTIFDDIHEEEQEDFLIKEIRCCNCFFDKVIFLLKKTIIKLILVNYMENSFI